MTEESTPDESVTEAAAAEPSRADQLAGNTFGPAHRIVQAEEWHDVLAALKEDGYSFFDWLSAVDEGDGARLVVHLLRTDPWDHVLVATFLESGAAVRSVTDLFAGAGWHERETHEMFGISFEGHLGGSEPPEPLLLPDGFEGHPLRKDFVLASRVVKPWPGAKEPGESDHDLGGRSPGRRRVKPPGVPDDWLQESGDEESGDE